MNGKYEKLDRLYLICFRGVASIWIKIRKFKWSKIECNEIITCWELIKKFIGISDLPLKDDASLYKLRIADWNGDLDEDFPPLDFEQKVL